MIKNQKQRGITQKKLDEIKEGLRSFQEKKGAISDLEYQLGMNSFNSLVKDLEQELNTYDALTKGDFHCLKANRLQDIPIILIGARLAQNITHKQLAEKLGMKEPQIQRYEATNYETASFPRIVEIAKALKVECYIDKKISPNKKKPDNKFILPKGFTPEQIELAETKIKETHSLMPVI